MNREKETKSGRLLRCASNDKRSGSALILVIVLTSLLAIIGSMFLLTSRMDSQSLDAADESSSLERAIESVVARISAELTQDVPYQPKLWAQNKGPADSNDYYVGSVVEGDDGYFYICVKQIGSGGNDPKDGGNDHWVITDGSHEYYDYPDPNNRWLASLEPIDAGTIGRPLPSWRQISDIYPYVPNPNESENYKDANCGLLHGYARLGYKFKHGIDNTERQIYSSAVWKDRSSTEVALIAEIIGDNAEVTGAYTPANEQINWGGPADADGDGVSDSRWVEVPGMRIKGQPVYAAVRVIDNGGMLNARTARRFDPKPDTDYTWTDFRLDGSRLTQINLLGLVKRANNNPDTAEVELNRVTTDVDKLTYSGYENSVAWNFNSYTGLYKPFDMSDEFELRNRFFLDQPDVKSRVESLNVDRTDWARTFKTTPTIEIPRNKQDHNIVDNWFKYFRADTRFDGKIENVEDSYDFRHLVTTYSVDRAINPLGKRAFNINYEKRFPDPNVTTDPINEIYLSLVDSIDRDNLSSAFVKTLEQRYAQVLANIIDYADSSDYDDANDPGEQVTVVYDVYDEPHYGFERPAIFFSEIAHRSLVVASTDPRGTRPEHKSYGIEIRKRYFGKNEDEWRIEIDTEEPNSIEPNDLDITAYGRSHDKYFVLVFETDPNDPNGLSVNVRFSDVPENGETNVAPYIELPVFPNQYDPCVIEYDLYFGDALLWEPWDHDGDPNTPEIEKPTRDHHNGLLVDTYGPDGGKYDPDPDLIKDTRYKWRIDDIGMGKDIDGNPKEVVLHEGQTLWFEVGDPKPQSRKIDPNAVIFDSNSVLRIVRTPKDTTHRIIVDTVNLSAAWQDPNEPESSWLFAADDGRVRSLKRDVSSSYWIKRIWEIASGHTLGNEESQYFTSQAEDPNPIHAGNMWQFVTVGEIGNVFKVSAYDEGRDWSVRWGRDILEEDVRFDLADPYMHRIFDYLSVKPNHRNVDTDRKSSTFGKPSADLATNKIPGRININTAPWYVIAQLPWMSKRVGFKNNESGDGTLVIDPEKNYDAYHLAKAIVAYRDRVILGLSDEIDYDDAKTRFEIIEPELTSTAVTQDDFREEYGFANIGELNYVIYQPTDTSGDAESRDYSMRYYALDTDDQIDYPDIHVDYRSRVDNRINDFEERDLLFHRISDLVTVRSDVFTAYICVRLGTDGPQKRVIAILDRSDVWWDDQKQQKVGDVKVIALHPVPDPK